MLVTCVRKWLQRCYVRDKGEVHMNSIFGMILFFSRSLFRVNKSEQFTVDNSGLVG